MARALQLARRGLGQVSPNPMVGAVLVKGGRIIAQGWHRRFGGPHAEVEALRDATRKGVSPRGADLYVTLEPCGHQGKTPPCAAALVAARIRRVVFAVRDPNPLTRGVGLRYLRRHDVEVSEGLLQPECKALNAPFFHWIQTGMPWVILKWAMTLDGRTATHTGESRWITGEKARAHAHALRRRVDGIMVGTETVLIDDPLLTARPARGRNPWRVVLDRRARLPLSLRLLAPESSLTGGGGRLYVTTLRAKPPRLRELQARGLRVLVVPEVKERLDLRDVLAHLGKLGISQLLVEGGARLHGDLLDAGLAHEVVAFVAPRLLGHREARTVADGSRVTQLEETPWLEGQSLRRLGADYVIEGRLGPGSKRQYTLLGLE